jgi:hypothetical protein
MSFESNIQKWVAIDNQIKVHNDKIKQLRDEKNALGAAAREQAESNGYKDSVIQITDGRLRFVETRVADPLSFRYIDEAIANIIPNPDSREKIIACLKEHRGSKVVLELKRYYNSSSASGGGK